MSQLYLAHFQIFGAKHGIRNGPPYPLSNAQRSSTERKRNPESKSSKEMSKDTKEKRKSSFSKIKRNQVNDIRTDADTAVKGISNMLPHKREDLSKYSDAELQKIVNRHQLEQRYVQLNPDSIEKGSEYVREFIQTAGGLAGLYLTYKTIKNLK